MEKNKIIMENNGSTPAAKSSQGGVQSVHRAMGIIQVVAASNARGIRLSDIAATIGLKVTTTHRLLASLTDEGMLRYDNLTKHYFIGLELARLGKKAYHLIIMDHCSQAIQEICRETGDTVFLFIKSGSLGLCLKRGEGQYPVRTLTINEGDSRPLGIGAGSLGILAYLPEKEIKRIITRNKQAFTDYNQSMKNVRGFIKDAHELGYVWADQQISEYVSAIALPLKDQNGHIIGSLSVAAIPERLNVPRREKIVKIVKREIKALSIPAAELK